MRRYRQRSFEYKRHTICTKYVTGTMVIGCSTIVPYINLKFNICLHK